MLNIDSWIRFALTELYAVLLLFILFRRPMLEEKKNVWLKILLVVLAMYLAHLFYVLLSPTYFFRRFAFSLERVNWVPFRVLSEWLAHPANFFGNVLLFMPLGIFEVLLHPGESRGRQILLSVATAAGVSGRNSATIRYRSRQPAAPNARPPSTVLVRAEKIRK